MTSTSAAPALVANNIVNNAAATVATLQTAVNTPTVSDQVQSLINQQISEKLANVTGSITNQPINLTQLIPAGPSGLSTIPITSYLSSISAGIPSVAIANLTAGQAAINSSQGAILAAGLPSAALSSITGGAVNQLGSAITGLPIPAAWESAIPDGMNPLGQLLSSPQNSGPPEVPFKVCLESEIDSDRYVQFNVMPTISVSGSVSYQAINPVHMPGTYQVYNYTPSRTYSLGDIKLVSRNSTEASANLAILNLLESWRMPFFGDSAGSAELQEYFGAPPEVLFLTAYSDDSHRGNIYRIPVVLSDFSYTYPTDCDYITTLDGTPFPIIMPITSITLLESHSAFELEWFSLEQYRTGNLTHF